MRRVLHPPWTPLWLLLVATTATLQCCSAQSTITTTTLTAPTSIAFNITSNQGRTFKLPQSTLPLYITLSLCAPPSSLDNSLPALLTSPSLYISNSSSQQLPSPTTLDSVTDAASIATLSQGFTNLTLASSSSGGAWIGVWAPDDALVEGGDGTGQWEMELSVSKTAPWVIQDGGASFHFDDTDSGSALLTTANFSTIGDTNVVVPDYTPIVALTSHLTTVLGRSRCFIANSTKVASRRINDTETTRGYGGGRRLQYEVTGLRESTNFTAWLVEAVDNGTRIWDPVFFATKTGDNCRLVHSLDFCPDVAYSVPSPPTLSTSDLIDYYNTTLAPSLTAFARTLTTFPCNSSAHGSYSFVSTCDDCYSSYRTWLCATTMPRCTDAPSNASLTPSSDDSTEWTIPIAYSQLPLLRDHPPTSRTPLFAPSNLSTTFPSLVLNSSVTATSQTPFPYAEVPPCLSVCTFVAARCPPFMGWSCPSGKDGGGGGTGAAGYALAQDVEEQERMAGDVGGSLSARAGNRRGDVYCNALGTDLLFASQFSSATRLRWLTIGGALVPLMTSLLLVVT